MSILSKAIYRFSAIPIKIPVAFFTELEKKINLKIHMEPQKTPNGQIILRKKKAGGITLSVFKLCYKAILIKTVL